MVRRALGLPHRGVLIDSGLAFGGAGPALKPLRPNRPAFGQPADAHKHTARGANRDSEAPPPPRFVYEYHLRDHQGNLRVAFGAETGQRTLRLTWSTPAKRGVREEGPCSAAAFPTTRANHLILLIQFTLRTP